MYPSNRPILFEEYGKPRRSEFVNAVEEVAARYGESGAFLAAQGINKKWKQGFAVSPLY